MSISEPMPRILIYQLADASLLGEYLALYGFEIMHSTSADIKEKLRKPNYDLCIMDHYNGLELLNYARAIDSKVPIIMVSSKYRSHEIIEALDAGADDYVSIPFNYDELKSRIKALLRRAGIRTRALNEIYEIGSCIFDVSAKTLIVGDEVIKLSDKEMQALSLLCAYKNELLPRRLLLQQVWTEDNFYNRRCVDSYICRLRKYFTPDPKVEIKTIRGMGFSLIIAEDN